MLDSCTNTEREGKEGGEKNSESEREREREREGEKMRMERKNIVAIRTQFKDASIFSLTLLSSLFLSLYC